MGPKFNGHFDGVDIGFMVVGFMSNLRFVNGTSEDFVKKIQEVPKPSKEEKKLRRLERGVREGTHRRCPSCGGIKRKAGFGRHKCKECLRPWRPNAPVRCSSSTSGLAFTPVYIKNKQDYEHYLTSEHWQEVRKRYWASSRPKTCYVCGGPSSDLHHRTYDRLGRELLTDLVAVCRDCHFSIHRYHNLHRDLSLWDATRKYRIVARAER